MDKTTGENVFTGMNDFAVIDVETTMIQGGEYPKTLFWGFADSTGYRKFKTTKALLKFLSRYEPRTLLHHSNFDVLQLLLDGANVRPLRSHNARLIRCKLGNHELLNSFSVFPVALGKIFACYGYAKTELSQLEKRNYEDCVLGLECFLKLDSTFQSLCGVSPLAKGTIAGTSFTAAQECAGEKMPRNDEHLEAYRGGRVEVFNVSECRADKFDINSSYPFSILDCPDKDDLLEVEITTKDHFGPLFDADVDDCLFFPNGKFTSFVYRSNWERYIEPHCLKTSIRVRKKTRIDFRWLKGTIPLVLKLYRLKQQSTQDNKPGIAMACKLLLNSMYGRIGLKGECERVRFMSYHPDTHDGTIYKLGRGRYLVFDTIWREVKSNYPFAAWITDNARARLYRAFVGSNAYYGDTDSVMCQHGSDHFEKHETLGENVGEWKHEGTERFQANNVKDYFWGEEEIRKGGSGFVLWTLKQLGSGEPPRQVDRERISELRKRTVTKSGVTIPITVPL